MYYFNLHISNLWLESYFFAKFGNLTIEIFQQNSCFMCLCLKILTVILF